MRTIEIRVNGQQIDYSEIKSIPLSLRKRTDKFLEIVGADGSEVDNVLRSLAIPDTTRNQTVLMTLMAQSSLGRGSTRVSVQVIVNGIMLFSGPGILSKTSKRSLAGISFAIELLGDGISLWEKLDKVKLTDLVLGQLTWTLGEVLNNWNDVTFEDYPAYWCPVVYGNLKGDGKWWIKDFRPSVPYWRIVKAMFEVQGYTIESEFYESQYFRRQAYLFGVGDKWKIVDENLADYRFRGKWEKSIVWSAVGFPPIGGVTIVTEQNDDPEGMYMSNGEPALLADPPFWVNNEHEQWFEIKRTGIYRFKITINAVDAATMQFFLIRGVDTIVNSFYEIGVSDEDGPGITVEFDQICELGDKVYLIAIGSQAWGGGFLSEFRFSKIHIRLLNIPYLGADIDIASCLHDNPVKDFLRGMSHQFNLAWAIDDVTKRVFFEPRFDYNLIEAGEVVRHRGFYRRDYPMYVGEIDAAEVSMEYVSPFGDGLKLGYKASGSDPMEKATLNDLRRQDSKQPPYFADIEFHDRGVAGQTSLNPYFTTLYQSQPSEIRMRIAGYLPTVLPASYKRGEKLPGIIWMDGEVQKKQDPPTFESDPKCGVMFPNVLSFSFYYTEEADVLYYSPGALAPWITQHKWIDIGGVDALSTDDNVPCYADLQSLDPTPRRIYGLVSTFYPNYISIIKEGQVLSCNIGIPLPTISSLSFRRMWRLPYDLNESVWILMELTGYKALISDTCNGSYIKYVPPTLADFNAIDHDDPANAPVVPDIAPETDQPE
jgi:hypothetical protein